MKALISTKGKIAQLSYELPHRIHDAKVYPVKASNGSTIIIYGHENGVRILWRGGRSLKPYTQMKSQPPKAPKVNGAGNDSIMIIDSDDEEPTETNAAQQLPDESEYESEDEELDLDVPYATFIQQIDMTMNTGVLHVTVPRIPAISAIRTVDSIPAVFSNKIVFAIGCVDYSIRIVTLPLSPPTHTTKSKPLSKGQSRWGEEVVNITSHTGHRGIINGIAMTWTSRSTPAADDAEETQNGDEESSSRRRRRSDSRQSRSRSRPGDDDASWDIMVASHSSELNGLLYLWRLPIGTDDSKSTIIPPSPLLPYQTLHLRSPASKVSFNVAQFPKRRHSQLLVAEVKGVVRIYDPFCAPGSGSRTTRLETSDTDSGTYLAAFPAPFEAPKNYSPTNPALTQRKRVLDAAWTSDGRSVVVLLSDGEWGIWDFDQSGPKPPPDPLTFAVRGFIGTSMSSSQSSGSTSPKSRNRPKLAPMTPNTRRTKEESLFQGSTSSLASVSRGGISTATLYSTSGGAPEDSVVLWYGGEVYRVPNLSQFWIRSIAGSGGSLSGPGLSRLQGLNLQGEALTTVDQFDTTTREARMAIPRDAIVVAEHRLIILTTVAAPIGRDMALALTESERTDDEEAMHADQMMLASGELDLGGMDRLLDNMASRKDAHGPTQGLGNPRKVLFASSTE